jgi:hypothetical protein
MKTLKIALFAACFSAAGTFIALSFGPYLWWLGALTGGIFGYIFADYQGFVQALKSAWTIIFGITKSDIIFVFRLVAVPLGFALSMILFISILGFVAGEIKTNFESNLVKMGLFFYNFFYVMNCFTMIGSIHNMSNEMENDVICLFYIMAIQHENNSKSIKSIVRLIIAAFLDFTFCTQYSIVRFILYITPKLPGLIKKFAILSTKFIYNVYKQIHSEFRLAFGIDCALGVCAGYFNDSLLVGAIVGAALAVANYYLVSKLLNVQPQASSFI